MANEAVHTLPISHLQPNPFQPREKMIKEDLSELVQSIKSYGILEPLVIAQTPAGYQIIAGERRWRAAKEAGLTEVPVYLKKTTPRGMLEMAIVENVQRVDLSPIERAQAFQQLIRDFSFSPSQIAQKVGKSPAYVSNSLKLLELPDAIKDGLLGGLISEGHARALSSIPSEKAMVDCYKVILKENASVRRAEDLSRRYREHLSSNKASKTAAGRPALNDARVTEWQKHMQALYHAKTQLKLVRSHRETRITISLKGSPEVTEADLEKIMAQVSALPKE